VIRARWAILVLLGLPTGCGTDDDAGERDGDSGAVDVVDAWTRPSPATVTAAAVYVTLENVGDTDDEVVALGSERCVTVVPHRTSFDEGVASMTALGGALTVPAGGSIEMEPNALHLMCLGIDTPFRAGDEFVLDIEFARQGLVNARVVVEDR